MCRNRALLVLLLLGATTAAAAERRTARPAHAGAGGEVVVFLGDSITWQNLYPAYIEAYYRRRYPQRRVRFVNLGVRGDTAAGAAMRLQRDLFPLPASLVVILLGMNDGGYRGYNGLLLRYYLAYLAQLVDLIEQRTEARTLLLTPTCVEPLDYNKRRYNRMLAAMAAGVRELAARRRLPSVDLFASFTAALRQARAHSIRLMLDPVHPGPAGHLVIAGALLDWLDPSPPRRRLQLVYRPERLEWKHDRACISFTHPHDNVYLQPAARAGLPVVTSGWRFASYRLVVPGLDGRLQVSIDGREQGLFAAAQLAAGLELDWLPRAPWVVEARRLWQLLQERWRLSYYLWDPRELGRDAWLQVNPPGREVIDKEAAYRRLLEVSRQIDSFPPGRARQHRLCLDRRH